MPQINAPIGPQVINPNIPQDTAPQPTEDTMMVGTDGRIYKVPASSYKKAIEENWRPATDKELGIEKKIQEGVKYGEEHRIETGLKRFGNEAAMGIPNYISNKNVGPEQAAIDEQVRERLSNRHPIESGLEKAAGFVAPLLIPGVGEAGEAVGRTILEGGLKGGEELLAKGAEESLVRAGAKAGAQEAVEASLGRKIASTAANYSTQGAIFSSPQASIQLAYGDPEQAAETMLWGTGLGGILGAAAAAGAAGLKGLAKGAADLGETGLRKLTDKQPNGISYLSDIARNNLGITDKQALSLAKRYTPDFIEKLVNRADEKGILQAADKSAATKELQNVAGKSIGEHYTKLEELLSDPETKKLMTAPSDVAAEFQERAMTKFPEINTATHATLKTEFDKLVSDMSAGGIDPSFDALQEIRTTIQKGKKAFDRDTPAAKLYSFADSVINKHLEEGAQKVFTKGEMPERFGQYLQDKFDYQISKELLKNENQFRGTGRLPTSLSELLGYTTGAGAHGYTTGALVGGMVGGHIGAAIGMGANFALKKLLGNEELMGKGISVLRKLSKDPASVPILGGLMAKEGQAALQRHIESIPSLLAKTGGRVAAETNPAAHILGDTTGLSKEQQYNKLVDTINQAVSDYTRTANMVGQHAQAFTGTSIQLASMVAEKKLNALTWLQQQIPKNPNPTKPFQSQEWKPSINEKNQFLQKVAVVNNPMIVFNHYQQDTLTKVERDTLQAVYPKIFGQIVDKVLQTAYDSRAPKVDYAGRVQLSLLTGVPLDASLKNISNIQEAIAPQPQQQGQAPAPRRRASSRPKFNKEPSLATDVERRARK